jgi:hypothetical protein
MYEISIEIRDQRYVDSLVVALVRQGYDVYLSYDDVSVCFKISKEEVFKIDESVS